MSYDRHPSCEKFKDILFLLKSTEPLPLADVGLLIFSLQHPNKNK